MKYLTENLIIELNERVIKRYSPKEIIGVREPGALEMLVNAPKEIVFGQELYPTIYEKAAILMTNTATKHVFHNGNKRTALAAMHLFMKLNHFETKWEFQEGIDFVLWVVNKHEKTTDFEKYKADVVERIKLKYESKD